MSEQHKHVLVIDDEEEIVNAAKRMLEKSGYQVEVAHNGKEGIDRIQQRRPDVVITDIIMPIMDGYEFFKTLRKENQTSDIPVIILTARPNMEDSFRALGVQGFITKPFTSESLVDKIERLSVQDVTSTQRAKILVAGRDDYTLNHMGILLKDEGYETLIAEDVPDLITKALNEVPEIIFIDVKTRGISSRETIKALRCFHKLDNSTIILYANFNPDKPGAFDDAEYLQTSKQACMEAGADHFIGRFSQVNFIESLNNIRLSDN